MPTIYVLWKDLALCFFKSITIDVNDSGLGVLTKFDFPDINKPTDVVGKMPYIIGFLVVGILGFVFYTSKKNKG